MEHDADLDEIVTMLEGASLIESYVDEDGRDALRLTPKGAQLGRAMAMAGDEAGADEVLAALLEERG